MFNFFKKPKAVITISRQTGQEEGASIVVNSYSVDRNEIFKMLEEAGEALRLRLIANNKIILEENKKSREEEAKQLPQIPRKK